MNKYPKEVRNWMHNEVVNKLYIRFSCMAAVVVIYGLTLCWLFEKLYGGN